MAMTIEMVAAQILACAEGRSLSPMRSELAAWADAITAHLTRPAQAVDVGAIREVAEAIGHCPTSPAMILKLADKLTRALAGEQAGLSVYECEGCGERPGKPHAPGCFAIPASPTPDKAQQ